MTTNVDAMVAVAVLFVLHVCILRECDDDRNVGVGAGGGVVSAGCEYMGGIRSSSFMSDYDVLEISGVRGIGGVCEICMCLARDGVVCVG